MKSSRTVLLLAVLCSLILTVGCASIWHELQPHRMRKLNSGPAPSRDPEFSSNSRPQQAKMVMSDAPASEVQLSVNSTDVVAVRSQSPE